MAEYAREFRSIHSKHTVRSLSGDAERRLKALAVDMWGGWRVALIPFALLGILAAPGELLFALASSALMFIAHLGFAHPPEWSVYYLEIQPVLACLTAIGLWRLFEALRSSSAKRAVEGATLSVRGSRPRILGNAVGALFILALLPLQYQDMHRVRLKRDKDSGSHRRFLAALSTIPEQKSIVFVRYGPEHNVHFSLIANEPDLEAARTWVVYDRGAENQRLMAIAPGRAKYLYDEPSGSLLRLR
jgi:hypothetical protein